MKSAAPTVVKEVLGNGHDIDGARGEKEGLERVQQCELPRLDRGLQLAHYGERASANPRPSAQKIVVMRGAASSRVLSFGVRSSTTRLPRLPARAARRSA